MNADTPPYIVAIVVTFNRKELLLQCLNALRFQTRRPDQVLIVNNASTDDTVETLHESGWLDHSWITLLDLAENTGGAGGFARGMGAALEMSAEWLWVMDDDAAPHPSALEELLVVQPVPDNIYGSVAVSNGSLSWPMAIEGPESRRESVKLSDFSAVESVAFIPFLGMLVHAGMVNRLGLPDEGFFLAKDDVEYCFRAKRQGAKCIVVRESHIEHPPAEYRYLDFMGFHFKSLLIPPWKRYYSVRNRILIAKRHFGAKLYYQTLPASLLHLVLSLVGARDKKGQLKAYVGGTIDGLLGKKGRRHEEWL